MSYTLKLKDSNQPLFLEENNTDISTQVTDQFIQFNSLNEMAIALLNKTFNIPSYIESEIVVSETDLVSINKLEHIESLVSKQDYSNNHKLINVDSKETFGNVSQRRPARMYLSSVKMDRLDPNVEKLNIIKIDKETADKINIGNTLIQSSDYSGKIFYRNETFTVIDYVNTDLLFENLNVNIDDFKYFAVLAN